MANEDLDAAIRDMQRQRRRGRWRLYGIIILVALTPVMLLAHNRYKQWRYRRSQLLDAGGAQELRDLLSRLRESAAACRAAWERQTRPEALAALRVDPEAGCSVDLMAPSDRAAQSYVEYGSIDGNYFGSWSVRIVGADGDVGGGGGCTSEEHITQLSQLLDSGEARKWELEEARRELRPEGHNVLVLATKREPGEFRRGPPDSFVPGTLEGRALVYSQAARRFVCGGEIDVSNSATVDVRFTHMKGNWQDREQSLESAAKGTLERDLEVQLRRRISSGLNALAGPQNPSENPSVNQ